MKIRLDQVDESYDWRETLELAVGDLNRSELMALGAVEYRGRINPTYEGFLFRVALSYEQTLRCMRCLAPVTESTSSEVDLLIHTGAKVTDEELELQEADLGVLVLEDLELDTRPILIEQIQLGIPMKPLCKDDCAGLCPSCGADCNAGPCGCEKAVDPRWAGLAGLKSQSTE
ncbi:MAG: DUF177 domain-containing protein [bacterium]|nr:DUF177 domain-containing protein [bacterium]